MYDYENSLDVACLLSLMEIRLYNTILGDIEKERIHNFIFTEN